MQIETIRTKVYLVPWSYRVFETSLLILRYTERSTFNSCVCRTALMSRTRARSRPASFTLSLTVQHVNSENAHLQQPKVPGNLVL